MEMVGDESTISEAIADEMEKNSVVHSHEKAKKILISPWEKINGFRTKVQDQFLQHCCGGEQIERTRVYHVWPGNNVFFFRGRLICGPDPKGLLLTVISISLSSWTFAVHVANDLGNHSAIIIISSILTMIVFISLGSVSTMDPGIIPRNHDELPAELGDKSRSKRVMIINGMEVKLKYCRVCTIHRPPRSRHCVVCDNCVEKFDHHCPWIGQCIGLRNYRFFVMFLVTALIFFLYILAFSCKRIREKLNGAGVIFLLRDCPETLALAAFSFAAVCFLGSLCCYHLYLITINQTAYEHFHRKYVSSRNPYNKGIIKNIKEVLLSVQPSSRVNFRADGQILGRVDSVISI